MKIEKNILHPEDYQEPACPFCTDMWESNPKSKSVPMERILSKLDAYLAQNRYDAAERHLLYWAEEAKAEQDVRGLLSLYNELMGLCRKLGKKEDAVLYAEAALLSVEKAKQSGTVTAATTFLNAATVFKAFGQAERGVPLFETAKEIYEKHLAPEDTRLAGLYNNMALALCDLKRFEEAKKLYAQALHTLSLTAGNEPDRAITYLNMADLAEAELGAEQAEAVIASDLEKAQALLDIEGLPQSGYYAYVCEKCAPTFSYFGWFFYAKELTKRAEKIYEGN